MIIKIGKLLLILMMATSCSRKLCVIVEEKSHTERNEEILTLEIPLALELCNYSSPSICTTNGWREGELFIALNPDTKCIYQDYEKVFYNNFLSVYQDKNLFKIRDSVNLFHLFDSLPKMLEKSNLISDTIGIKTKKSYRRKVNKHLRKKGSSLTFSGYYYYTLHLVKLKVILLGNQRLLLPNIYDEEYFLETYSDIYTIIDVESIKPLTLEEYTDLIRDRKPQ